MMFSLLQIPSGPQFEARTQLSCPPGRLSPSTGFCQAPGHLDVSIGLGLGFPGSSCCRRGRGHVSGSRWKTDGWRAPPCPHPSPDTITNRPVKGTYVYELFINLPTLIYDPWLDLTLDS